MHYRSKSICALFAKAIEKNGAGGWGGFTALLSCAINEDSPDLNHHQDRIHDMMSIVLMDADIFHFFKTQLLSELLPFSVDWAQNT